MRDRDATLMAVARVYEEQSTCDRNHVGAVIAIDGRVIGTGYNGTPAGMPHCDHTCNCLGGNSFSVRRNIPHESECPSVTPCNVAVHAEANAITFCTKYGVATNDATLYTTLTPCVRCSQLIINAGIVRVVYDRPYRDMSGADLMVAAGLRVDRL